MPNCLTSRSFDKRKTKKFAHEFLRRRFDLILQTRIVSRTVSSLRFRLQSFSLWMLDCPEQNLPSSNLLSSTFVLNNLTDQHHEFHHSQSKRTFAFQFLLLFHGIRFKLTVPTYELLWVSRLQTLKFKAIRTTSARFLVDKFASVYLPSFGACAIWNAFYFFLNRNGSTMVLWHCYGSGVIAHHNTVTGRFAS